MTAATSFGAVLRSKRLAHGVTLARLAATLGVSVPYLSDVERGRRSPLRAALIENAATLAAISEGTFRRAILGRGKVPRKLKKKLKRRGEWGRLSFSAVHFEARSALADGVRFALPPLGDPAELAAIMTGRLR